MMPFAVSQQGVEVMKLVHSARPTGDSLVMGCTCKNEKKNKISRPCWELENDDWEGRATIVDGTRD